jgi:hypothetical protein
MGKDETRKEIKCHKGTKTRRNTKTSITAQAFVHLCVLVPVWLKPATIARIMPF